MRDSYYRQLGERFDHRMGRRREVLQALGIALPKHVGEKEREAIRRSIVNCLACNHARSCLEWLRSADAKTEPPEFCPNKATFLEFLKEEDPAVELSPTSPGS